MSDEFVRILPYSVDLSKTVEKTDLHELFVMGDSLAHRIELEITRGGEAVSLSSSTVTGYFTNFAEDTTIMVDGEVKNGKAAVTLSKPCYTLHGQFVLTIQITGGGVDASVFCGEGFMRQTKTETIIYDDYVIYDVSTLLTQISAMKTATKDAQDAASAANTAAGNANEKASAANTAAQGASGWANATMTATALAPGSAPTATVTTASDGHKVITLGIPRGNTGATPQISVEVSTGAAGSEAIVSVTGTAENPVIHLTIPRGDTGAIENLTINGKTPDASGTVTLTAEDVGALAANGTAANASKLGGKAPEYYIQPRNLLDNSDFTNPVNQRGAESYTATGYTIDRWRNTNTNGVVKIVSGGLQFYSSGGSGSYFRQLIPSGVLSLGKTYSLAICDADGKITVNRGTLVEGISISAFYPTQDSNGSKIGIRLDYDTSNALHNVILSISNTVAYTIKWLALYEGSYTADTLPPYVPKGYAAELAECKRYYQQFISVSTPISCWGTSANQGCITLFVPVAFRTNPTIDIPTPVIFNDADGNGKTLSSYNILDYNVNSANLRIRIINDSSWVKGNGVFIGSIYISADL